MKALRPLAALLCALFGLLTVPSSAPAGQAMFAWCNQLGSDIRSGYAHPVWAIDSFEVGPAVDLDVYPPGEYRLAPSKFGSEPTNILDMNQMAYVVQTRDGDYPGVQSAVVQDTSGSVNADISGNVRDAYDHYNRCNSANGYLEMEADDANGDHDHSTHNSLPLVTNALARWRFYAPADGLKTEGRAGWYGGIVGWSGMFGNTDTIGGIGVLNDVVSQNFNGNQDSASGGAAVVRWNKNHNPPFSYNSVGVAWFDRRNTFSQEVYPAGNPYGAKIDLNQQNTGNKPLTAMNTFLGCVDISGAGCRNLASDQDAGMRLWAVYLWASDNRPPTIALATSGLTEVGLGTWHRGTKHLSFDVLDGGLGVDSVAGLINGTSIPQYAQISPCRFSTSGNPLQTRPGASQSYSVWNAYSGDVLNPYDARIMGWETGPCPAQASMTRNFNTSQAPFHEGLNQLVVLANDFSQNSNQMDPGHFRTASGQSLFGTQGFFCEQWDPNAAGGNGAPTTTNPAGHCTANNNTAGAVVDIPVDNRPMQQNAFSVSGPSTYQTQWIRGTATISTTLREDTSQAVPSNWVSGAFTTQYEYRLGSGAWTPAGVIKAAPAGVIGTPNNWSSDQQLDTTTIADGTSVSFANTNHDLAGNSSRTVPGVTRTVDNTPPVITTPNPGSTPRQNYQVTTSATDATSGVHHVECVLDSDGNRNTTADQTVLVSAAQGQTVCSYNITNDNEQVLYRYFDNAGNATAGASTATWSFVDPSIDQTAPTLTLDSGSSSSWGNTSRKLKLTATDSGTGVANIRVVSTTSVQGSANNLPDLGTSFVENCQSNCSSFVITPTASEEASRTVTFRATDGAGNVSNTVTATIRIDKTAPVLSGSLSTDPASPLQRVNAATRAEMTDPDPDGSGPAVPSGLAGGSFEMCDTENDCGSDDFFDTIDHSGMPGVDEPACTVGLVSTGGAYECNFSAGLYSAGDYKLRAKSADVAGNRFTSDPIDVEIDAPEYCPVP